MKHVITVLMLAGLTAFAGVKEEVTETVSTHFKAIETGEVQLLEKVWLKDKAQINEINAGRVKTKDINKTFALWTSQKNPNLKGEIISITEITGELVIVKVSLNWKETKYTDALTLTKTRDGWKIINKTYVNPEKESGYSVE